MFLLYHNAVPPSIFLVFFSVLLYLFSLFCYNAGSKKYTAAVLSTDTAARKKVIVP